MRPYKKKRSVEVAVRFGTNLARARRRAALSQEELATRASLHRTEIGMLEHGQRVARIDTVIRLSGAMAIEPAELLAGIHWTVPGTSGGGFSFSGEAEAARKRTRSPSRRARS
ncbi:MAG: helix-turn-helix transcriptional regulator [Solirubrobacterales bacterium]